MRTDSTTLSDQALTAARAQARRSTAPTTCPTRPAATSARSRTPRRPTRPSARPARRSAPPTRRRARSRGRAPPLRPDLEAHGGLPDGRRHRHQRPGPPGGPPSRAARRPARRPSSRPAAGSSRSPASCGPTSRARTIPRPSWPTARCVCPRWPRATWSSATAFEPGSHTTQPPARYTEASLVKAMEELGRGPAVDLRQRHRHHPRPRLRVEEGHRPGALASPPSPWSACSSATSATWSTTASPPPWRTTSTRSPRAARSRCPG